MKNLELIGEELFNKIRGRFPSVTIGTAEGMVTNVPKEARFFDFDFTEGSKKLGKVSVSIDEKSLNVMYSNNFIEGTDKFTKEKWYGFLKELRYFAKKRLLNFDTRDITKSNLNRRDYKFLASTSGEQTMSESKMYGTSKTSYQDLGNARLAVKHSKPVNQELAAGRTQHIESIYIESAEGERFKYPYRHLNGARAMARHVSEGGNAYDDFGKHIVGLSEEMYKLRKFKNYMGRSSVMAESLADYMDAVNERIETVKKTVENLQKQSHYKEAFESFETPVFEDVPEDIASNWIDQLTIKQFNEELKDVFPYIYKLVNEKTKAKELGPEDLLGEGSRADDLEDAYERGGESQLARALGITTDQLDDEINEVGYGMGLHADDDREDIIQRIIDDHAEEDGMDDYDGQPSSYDEYQDLHGGDDWDHGQYDFDGFESWANDVVDSGIVSEMHDDPRYRKWLQIYKKSPDAAEAIPGHEKYLKYYQDTANKKNKKPTKRKENSDEMDIAIDPSGAMGQAEEKPQIPVTEFVLSLFDRETGQFPKGETAVLTAVEKDYGEQYINGAKEFIEAIKHKFEDYQMRHEASAEHDAEMAQMRELAGLTN